MLSKMMQEKSSLVISTTTCPYCTKAKRLLDMNQVGYKEVLIDEVTGED